MVTMTDDKKRFPTARDVALRAGVSQPSVSRAFTAGASISPDVQARVLKAAEELGYRPNLLARSLNQRRSQVIGLITGNVENPFFAQTVDRFVTALEAIGCRILLLHTAPNTQVDQQVDELLSYRVRAVILLAVNLSSRLIEECARGGIPVILFNRTVQRETAAFSIVGDNDGGARAIARHFLATGRGKPAYMAGYPDSSTSNTREAAFFDHVVRAGLPTPRRACGYYSREGAVAATRALLSDAANRPDAVFCANDLMAIAAIETARGEFGLEPGRDIAIAGFDDIAMAAWPSFSLTTYSQPIDDMVGHALHFIEADDREAAPQPVIVPGRLIIRNST
jgi:DNA-binding LacI/PurR family transcriptional regulator